MEKYIFILLFFVSSILNGQTTLVNQQFSSVAPTGWTSTSSLWSFNYNYGTNSRSGSYTARLSSAANGNTTYAYIPITFKSGYSYTISFYSKRICSLTINTNETANQTTLLSNQSLTNSNCNSNWSNWYNWSVTYNSTSNTSGYFQILANTVYGGPTSIYIDDVTITENIIPSMPIKLISFTGKHTISGNEISWVTVSETNNDYFTLYRTNNLITWNEVSIINGGGNSSDIKKYTYIDNDFNKNINYYMLRQTDYDGKYSDSDVIFINNNEERIELIKVINILGQEIDMYTPGIKILFYSDGTIIKKF